MKLPQLRLPRMPWQCNPDWHTPASESFKLGVCERHGLALYLPGAVDAYYSENEPDGGAGVIPRLHNIVRRLRLDGHHQAADDLATLLDWTPVIEPENPKVVAA